MNKWLNSSIEYANQKSYLDDLFSVYPIVPEETREIDEALWKEIEKAFNEQNSLVLLKSLLKLDLFPLKDSYVAYLKRDKLSLERNPATINRLCGRLYQMGLGKIYKRCAEPKETNRQIGPLFNRWLNQNNLGFELSGLDDFTKQTSDAILSGSDLELTFFANEYLNYQHPKRLDFVARVNGKYIIGEAKFLTDFGGHQNAQFNDAISLLEVRGVEAIKIAILDGVCYIKGGNKMYIAITGRYSNYNIMSSLVLGNFLKQYIEEG